MAHRDDREAAHHRAEALDRELREAKREIAVLKGTASPAPRSRGRGLSIAVLLLFVAGVAAGLLSLRSRERARAASARRQAEELAMQSARERELRALQEAEVARAEAQARLAALAEEQRRLAAQTAAVAHEIVWRGTLEGSALPGLRVGEECMLRGSFIDDAGVTKLRALSLRCGVIEVERREYDPPRSATGLREGRVAGSEAKVYLFSFDDVGEGGAAASSLAVSTMRHELRVSNGRVETAGTSVFLRDVSEAREGPSLGRAVSTREPAFAEVIDRSVRVAQVRGLEGVSVGDRCEFQVRPVWEFPESCRIALRCNGQWIYGAGEAGYLTCAVARGRAVSALDENPTSNGGDPRLRWTGTRVTVGDFSEHGGAWELSAVW